MNDLSARPIQGYFMVPEAGPRPRTGHTLGGHQSISGAVSPNSGRPLLLLALIDTTDRRLELQAENVESLPLLYSWTCDIHQGVFSYRVGPGEIEILDFQVGQEYTDFPYENYPDEFAPQAMKLEPLSEYEQQAILELNDEELRGESPHEGDVLDRPRHQLGGTPRLMQEVINRKCPRCKGDMPLFAAIADDNGTPRGFTNNSYVQVIYHLCRVCWIVNCYNLTD